MYRADRHLLSLICDQRETFDHGPRWPGSRAFKSFRAVSALMFASAVLAVTGTGIESAHARPALQPADALLDSCNVIWNSQSRDPSESMPVGGGDVGLNVWVENNELLFYIGRSGTFDENNQMLKLGRVRLRLDPNPFNQGGEFRQELNLRQGCITISARAANAPQTTINLWVEVFRPVIHVEVDSAKRVSVAAQYENWRTADRELPDDGRKARFPCMSLVGYPGKVTLYADQVDFKGDAVLWYHRNNNNDLVFDKLVEQQELESVKSQLWNPSKNRTFGGLMKGQEMVQAGTDTGRYASTDFKAWKLRSRAPATKHRLAVYLHTDQPDGIEQWERDLNKLIREAERSAKSAWRQHQECWRAFWERSHVFINPDRPDAGDKAWQVGRNYQLYRFMQGCNARGEWPTKFNGSFFTFDPAFVQNKRGVQTETPDFRTWGGGSFTAQNQRLVYWPMIKNGDFDSMPSQFDFYRRALRNAELRTKVYWGHGGCSFTEQLENLGLPVGSCYGWIGGTDRWGNRDPNTPKGIESVGVGYEFGHQLDFSFMMLEYFRFSGRDISPYLPFIESAVRFFDEHYQWENLHRTGKALDENGRLVLYPARGAESYVDARNPADVIAGLQAVVSRLLDLPGKYVSENKKRHYRTLRRHVPPLPLAEKEGRAYFAGAESWSRFAVGEIPQLYCVFPYNLYGIGRPDLDLARFTWTDGLMPRQKNVTEPWYQGGIFTARLGLTDEAKAVAMVKLGDTGLRFPAFRDSDDWTPDHNWLGAGMIGLQEMLMQTPGDKIYLLPAWPKDWDVEFKLHAPKQTTVECKVRGGAIVNLNVKPTSRMKDVVMRTDW